MYNIELSECCHYPNKVLGLTQHNTVGVDNSKVLCFHDFQHGCVSSSFSSLEI